MLRKLRVQGFKSLRNVEVDLARLVVVFGANAAGKSNLLESLVLLSRVVMERTLADAFDSGLRGYANEAFSFGPGGAAEMATRDHAELRLEAEIDLPSERPEPRHGRRARLRYEVAVRLRPASGELTVADERLSRLSAKGTQVGNAAIERVEHKLHLRRKGKQSHPFEEPVGLGHTVVSNRQYAGDRFPDLDALRAELAAWRVVYLDPREAMRHAQPPREVDDIGERGEFLVPFLHRLASHERYRKDFQAIVRAARAVIPSIEEVRTELVPSRGEIDLSVKQDGVWMSGRVISEGTLRVLALCAMAASPFQRRLVAFEEPENGVHPRRIEVITKLLATASRKRQVVVTTHSPLVVAEIAHLVRDGTLDVRDVVMLQCTGGPDGTRVRTFDPNAGLWVEPELRSALVAAEDAGVLQSAIVRGWMDG